MRFTLDALGWTLDVHLSLSSEEEDEEGTDKLGTSDHTLAGFAPDPAFIDRYPEEDE